MKEVAAIGDTISKAMVANDFETMLGAAERLRGDSIQSARCKGHVIRLCHDGLSGPLGQSS